jgi:competence protein ComEA
MLAWLERYQLLALTLAGIILGLGLVVPGLLASDPDAIVFREGSGLPLGTPIRVHVAGAVLSPGVYELREGERVVDALTAAGGPTDGADLEALNLARRVRDGEQLLVPARTTARSTAVPTLAPGQRLDLNLASEAQLELLPGIGEAYARRIVDSRRVDGPYRSAEDLLGRRVLPASTFEQIRDLVMVGQ